MTPSPIATYMATLFKRWPKEVFLLDPGAGIGSLTEAFAARFFKEAPPGACLRVDAYEIEPVLVGYLARHLEALKKAGSRVGRSVTTEIIERNFINEAVFALSFGRTRYTHAILNPPYAKIGTASAYRKLLRGVGIETVNLYTAFLALAVALMAEGGEAVAIVPRSFCNGTYFRSFRKWLLDRVAIGHIHVFESRKYAFQDDAVLQENIIVHLVRGEKQGPVTISTSHDSTFSDYTERRLPFACIVKPLDVERFIHIPTIEVNGKAGLFVNSLEELGLDVATGPVVDFRLRQHWLSEPQDGSAPLLYTHHFSGGNFRWPRDHKKPNAIAVTPETRRWLLPPGWYVVTKRFSSKEERRRVVAYVVDPRKLPQGLYGFENHLNVIHRNKHGLDAIEAYGVALFLNSTVVDQQFRTFSGHTQVNATDLRAMRFPTRAALACFGRWARRQRRLTQEKIDDFIDSYNGD